MSAIYGAIDLNRNAIDKDLPARFDAGYTKCKIDKNNSLLRDNVYMHCGVQYFYPRAKAERLPIYDEESNVYITADCVIDNRKTLIPELLLDDRAADGDIILAAYKKWGKDCSEHLRGLFAFVIYDAAKNEVYAATDQFSQRCLFYHLRDGVFYFSTLFFPIPEATKLKFKENERWLVDEITLRGPVMITEPKETALIDVYKIVCGTYITANVPENSSEIKLGETRYYNPNDTVPTDWSITLEQSEKMIKETVAGVMEDILQEQIDVATMMSSGLDSSTVSCNAAIILGKRGGKIYSYTSVPDKDAGLKNTKYTIYDETEGVKAICKQYPNIIPEFVDSKGRSFLTETEEFVDAWELPCKSQQNAVWIDEIYKKVSDSGQKILLSGSTGNCTFSAGSYLDTIYYYLTKLRVKDAYDVLGAFKSIGISRKKEVKLMLKRLYQYFRWNFDYKLKDCYSDNATRKDIGEKYSLSKRFVKILHYFPFQTTKTMREAFYLINSYAQIGEVETKDSLHYGVIDRDPTRTVALVDMCFKIPILCYANKDYDRRLLRAGMRGIVPDEILNNITQRGKQSGDNVYRVGVVWDKIRDKWVDRVFNNEILLYLDKKKLESLLKDYDLGIEKANYDNVLVLSEIYSFAIYLDKIKKYCK
nr:asparagine synthase-related protein [uncultured Butyrivibrio sp.]